MTKVSISAYIQKETLGAICNHLTYFLEAWIAMDQRYVPQWQPSYSVGNSVLDDQHKKLLGLCQEAVSCMSEDGREGNSHFHSILNELADYVNRHFQTEEAILERCGYPLLEHHRNEHLEYQIRLNDFLLSATLGEINRDGLHHYLSQWWSEHIQGSDKQYAKWIEGISG